MAEMSKHGEIGRAATKADMDRKTARKYIAAGKLPSEMVTPRDWRTREDPFDEHWPLLVGRLTKSPALEAKTLFDWLCEQFPGRYEPGQLRTLQRHVRQWRAEHGPDQSVFFAQQHRPGEAMQTDFTRARELGVTIAGQLFVHLLCVVVLPYSNWKWATVCLSESMAALRRGLQRALFQLGRRPRFHQTDNSTAATHKIPDDKAELFDDGRRKRPFNEDYLALMRHFGITPRTTEVGAKEQNGDVESGNGALKRSLDQALELRGSRDFESVEAWQVFVDQHLTKQNKGRGTRLADEMAVMQPVDVKALPEFTEDIVRVSEWSTVRVAHCSYSVPSRLIGHRLKVHLYEERLEFWFADKLQMSCERLIGRQQRRIDYRHVIWSLVLKPGAFARWVYRDELFPSLVFRKAYDALQTAFPGTRGDLEYLRVLHLAATTLETLVEAAVSEVMSAGITPLLEHVRPKVTPTTTTGSPSLEPPVIDLQSYDDLLEEVGT